jgi:hypothetical protein
VRADPLFQSSFSSGVESSRCPHAHPSLAAKLVKNYFSLFGRERIFQTAPLYIYFSPTADLMIRLSISSRTVFQTVLSDVLRIFCRVSSLVPRSAILLLYSERVRCFFQNVLTSGFPLSALSLSEPLQNFHFRSAGTERHVSRFRKADNFCRDPTLSRVCFIAHRRRRTTKRSRSFCRSTAASVASGFASKSMASCENANPQCVSYP